MRVEPALCDPDLVSELTAAMRRVGQEPFLMPSGGGHDAAVFAGAGVRSAMVIVRTTLWGSVGAVRNRNGSHNPAETMALDDFVAATDIVHEFLMGARL